jgi:carboxymethylenebutenolidase
MQTQAMTISTLNANQFGGHLVLPKTTPAPGIILIQEIFGINTFMREMADFFAAAGYVTIVPDLFWRFEPNIQLDDQNETERERAFELYEDFNEDNGIDDLIATLEFIRQHSECNGVVGCVGFCLGGKLAYLMATRSNVTCSVSYYGVGIEHDLSEASQIQKPLLLHIAEQDQFVPADAQNNVRSTLSPNPLITLHTYPNVNHAFARTGGNSYNAEAAKLANDRTIAFLQKYLQSNTL